MTRIIVRDWGWWFTMVVRGGEKGDCAKEGKKVKGKRTEKGQKKGSDRKRGRNYFSIASNARINEKNSSAPFLSSEEWCPGEFWFWARKSVMSPFLPPFLPLEVYERKTMKMVNYEHLSLLLGPLNTLSEAECEQVLAIDPDDEQAVREVLRRFVKPEFERLTPESQETCKNSFRYFLTTGNAPFWHIIAEHQESPVRSPSHPIDLFIWLWRELFPGEDYKLENSEAWTVDNKSTPLGLSYRPRRIMGEVDKGEKR